MQNLAKDFSDFTEIRNREQIVWSWFSMPIYSVNEIDKLSEAIHESWQSSDSQETISENNVFPEINEDETSKNYLLMNYKHLQDFLEIRIF